MIKYDLKNLTSEQAHIIIDALDFYDRISIGQFEEIGKVIRNLHSDNLPKNIYYYQFGDLFRGFKWLVGLAPNESFGVGSPKQDESGKIAYDIQCVLRNKVASTEKHDDSSVWHRTPLHYSRQPLPEVEVRKDDVEIS